MITPCREADNGNYAAQQYGGNDLDKCEDTVRIRTAEKPPFLALESIVVEQSVFAFA